MVGLKLLLYSTLLSNPAFIYTEALHYNPASPTERFPDGANLHAVLQGQNTTLLPTFHASADPSISFDGKRVLFSGKAKPNDPWQIWEMPVSGGIPRHVITTPDDCITPFYLPPDRIVFARRTRAGFQLQTAPLSGGSASPLSFVTGNQIVSDVLQDGRILFESMHPAGFRDLYTVYSDGSGVETHRCDHRRDRYAARELASGDIIFQTATRLARFTSARAVEVPLPLPVGEFAAPIAEVAATEWLVSYRANSSLPFALYEWAPGKAQPANALAVNAVQPVIVRPRTRPRIHPSSLGNRDGANTLCLNVYTSKLKIAEGSVSTVRVYAQDDRGASVALGTAPVETDGSFYLNLPADRPVRFELINSAGKTVAAEKGWFWYRRGEQRVCVGCHAGPERAPENAQPLTLLRSTDPVKLTLGSAK